MKVILVLLAVAAVASMEEVDPPPGIYQVQLLKQPRKLNFEHVDRNKFTGDFMKEVPTKNLLKIMLIPIENIPGKQKDGDGEKVNADV